MTQTIEIKQIKKGYPQINQKGPKISYQSHQNGSFSPFFLWLVRILLQATTRKSRRTNYRTIFFESCVGFKSACFLELGMCVYFLKEQCYTTTIKFLLFMGYRCGRILQCILAPENTRLYAFLSLTQKCQKHTQTKISYHKSESQALCVFFFIFKFLLPFFLVEEYIYIYIS